MVAGTGMRCSSDNKALRIALDFPDGIDVNQHRRLVEEARQTHPHSVKFVSAPRDFTCAVYALELNSSDAYRVVIRDFDGEVFAGKKFIDWMLNGRFYEVDHPTSDALALYFSASDWTHVGVVTGTNRITSNITVAFFF